MNLIDKLYDETTPIIELVVDATAIMDDRDTWKKACEMICEDHALDINYRYELARRELQNGKTT
jgi:hypothetical protein